MGTANAHLTARAATFAARRTAGHVPAALGRGGTCQADCPRDRHEPRRRRRRPQAVAQRPGFSPALAAGPAPHRQAREGDGGVSTRVAACAGQGAAGLGISLYGLEHRTPADAPEQAHRPHRQPRLAAPPGPPRGFYRRPTQTHAAWEAERGPVQTGQKSPESAKKGASEPNALLELWFADASEFELLPHVVRCWMRKGQQKQVKTPGKNRRLAAFGALGYGHHAGGLFLHHTQ